MTQQRADTDVRVEVTVDASIERTFQVFTERVGSWWPRAYRLGDSDWVDVVIEPREGGRWYEHAQDGEACDWGRVLVWDPPNHVVLSWQIGVTFQAQSDPELASRVDVRFEADGPGRTNVTLVHSDFEKHGEGWQSMRDGVAHEGGWPGIMPAFAEVAAE